MTDSEFIYSERSEVFTTWKNNNDKTARFKLLMHEKKSGRGQYGADCKASKFLNVEVKPGDEIRLPSEYDQAIRKISLRTNMVVGGLCPWLIKVGEENIVVEKSLDYKSATLEREAKELVVSLKKENDLREALELLDKRKRIEQAALMRTGKKTDKTEE